MVKHAGWPGEWNVIRTEEKAELIFNREKAKEAEPRILANYKIMSPYSDDVRKQINGHVKDKGE